MFALFAPTEEICRKVIKQRFGALAEKWGLRLICVTDKMYEIVSPTFTLYVRFGVWPWTDREEMSLVTSIVPTTERNGTWDHHGENELSIYAVTHYYGSRIEHHPIRYRWDCDKEAKQVAHLADVYCTSLIKGLCDDWNEIRRQFNIDKQLYLAEVRMMVDKMPGQMKAWRLPGESDDEWVNRVREQAKEPLEETKGE
jgi:hypothetical protein